MEGSARDNYLFTAIRTAPPCKLHLMLVEAAIRWCNRARERFQTEQVPAAVESLIRAEEVMTRLLADLNPEIEPARNLAGIYLYIFRTLQAACKQRNPRLLDDVLRILAIEQETWRLACEKFSAEQGETTDRPAATPTRHVPPPISSGMNSMGSDSGFSIEA